MKLKQKPEDFIVEEINNFKIASDGLFNLYQLKKKSIDTLSLLSELSRINEIPLAEISFAGIKDKHGITTQYISTPRKFPLDECSNLDYSIKFLGNIHEKINRGDLIGNKFTITIRDLSKKEIDLAKEKIQKITRIGFPNYFDSQRFGSLVENQFIITYVLSKDYESAVKLYLTGISKGDNSQLKVYKKIIKQKWPKLLEFDARNSFGRPIIQEYQKTQSWKKAYLKIPALQKELFVSAYQSYIWNESIKLLFKQNIFLKNLYSIPYTAGTLTFYLDASKTELQKIPKTFVTANHIPPKNTTELNIIKKILSKEGLDFKNLDIKEETNNFFGLYDREIIVYPKNLIVNSSQNDEINSTAHNKLFKIQLSFELPKGSYATVLIKALFGR